ncbi:SPL family radical SAM protein [Modestobacter versicolor]|uniref:Radical SAM protein n=1 Tax=Modestobacter versicolor TaxID=429133 RepID=A0A323VCD9_9ACTN|nr:radical SAM protein [Modestobacter versicolor]MBB3677457.1 spore photoproduct lyase [Modestobacter versicolor]PZA20866.1 radical SAM protein [Modestobacter versicolor]
MTTALAAVAPAVPAPTRLWTPSRVLVTRSAAERPHGQRILARLEAAGVDAVELLPGDRLPNLRGDGDRAAFMAAKQTLAVVVPPPSKRRLQPIPPSADWRFDLAEGCPAHCQYCYLAGSLSGPPITRVFADLDEVLGDLAGYVGRGAVTSGTAARGDEGTTFEASCYTDPLALEHLTGGLATAVQFFGTHAWPGPVQLRATTKFDDVAGLLDLPHGGRTRLRFSVNAASVARRFEGATSPVAGRVAALAAVAAAGYPVGLTIAPIMPTDGWREEYGELLDAVAAALPPGADLTVECITHRFTPGSKATLTDWYPRTKLEMDEAARTTKRGKFGSVKHVYPRETMAELRGWFETALADRLPTARVLYWT